MSQQIHLTIAALFGQLAEQYEALTASTTHIEMSGQEYINVLDNPETGEGDGPVIANTPADVFNSGADVSAVFNAAEIAEVSAIKAAAAAFNSTPIYTMLPAAGPHSRDALIANGWDDDALVANNMMTIEHPKPPAPPAPPPPPPAAAPTPPAAGTPTPGAIELDSTGLPWDARIHSGGRTKKANGEWVAKKNVQAGVVAQVTAELRQKPQGTGAAPFVPPPAAHVPLAQSAAAVPPPPAPAPPAPGAGLPKTKEQALAEAQASVALAHAIAAAPKPGPNAMAAPTDAKSLMEWVSVNGYGPYMNTVSNMLGLAGFGLLLQPENAHHIGTAYTTFLALGKPGA